MTHTKRRSRRRGERGQSLVEFAFILPIFLLVVMATVDFGWALRSWISTTNAAREGARVGITGASAGTIESRVVDAASDLLTTDNVTVTNAQGEPGSNLTVEVTFTHNYITPVGGVISFLTGGALPNPLPITTSTTMRME